MNDMYTKVEETSSPADEARKLRAIQDEEYFAMLSEDIAKVRNEFAIKIACSV